MRIGQLASVAALIVAFIAGLSFEDIISAWTWATLILAAVLYFTWYNNLPAKGKE